jgi:hypothetical protein
MDMPDGTMVAFNDAPTSVPVVTSVAAPPGTVTISMPGGSTVTVTAGASNVLEIARALAPVTNNFHSGAVYNVEAGGTVNNTERQTIYTGGGAPNGTGGSPTVTASALEAAVEAAFADLKSTFTKLCQDIQESVTGQGERLQATMAEQFEELKSSIEAFMAANQTPMTGVPNRQLNSTS